MNKTPDYWIVLQREDESTETGMDIGNFDSSKGPIDGNGILCNGSGVPALFTSRYLAQKAVLKTNAFAEQEKLHIHPAWQKAKRIHKIKTIVDKYPLA